MTNQTSLWDNSSYPEVKKEIPISSDEWNNLVGALDVKKFNLLPEIIGCPDCADGGAEWVEISDGKVIKKVTFEYGASISGIETLIKIKRDGKTFHRNSTNNKLEPLNSSLVSDS